MSKVNKTIYEKIKQYIDDQIYLCNKEVDNIDGCEHLKAKFKLALIKEYAKNHKLFFMYLMKKISLKEIVALLGYSERNVMRYLCSQRTSFINYINKYEDTAEQKAIEVWEGKYGYR